MKKILHFVCFTVLILMLSSNKPPKEYQYIQFVNPFIGTDAHGHTYPGATLPFGMVQLSPNTRLEGWDGCSGYHYSDSIIYGFSHTHLSGTGVPDYCDILIMPTTGKVNVMPGTSENNYNGYSSLFSHKQEKASPGYYSVKLLKYNILAELTTTKRVGIHKYIFPKDSQNNLIIDLKHRDKVIDSYINFVSETEIEGYRFSSSWARNEKIYFVIQLSRPCIDKGIVLNDTNYIRETSAYGNNIRAFLTVSSKNNQPLIVKVAISFVDIEGARKNLATEAQSWDFDKYKKQAANNWENILSKISIDADQQTKEIFYTALYHSYIQPNIFNDCDGRYRGRDDKIHQYDENYYTVFSLWDTYRAWHPLMTIMEPYITGEFIKTFLLQYEQSGLLPIWELASNETNCMIGYHSVSVIYDAWQKGIRNFNEVEALESMKTMATPKILSLANYETNGCVLSSEDGESVSKTLEYAYDDWCIAQMALSLGQINDYEKYINRSLFFKNLFDPETKFFRARNNGSWIRPFSPYDVSLHYTEANAWQYSFYVPHDINDFILLMGGKDALEQKLDSLFYTKVNLSGREQVDITGLIGQYAHGNEPSHHIAYLYNFIGKPYKTQELIDQIALFYTNKPDGLIGNEDCGQMSAWYIFSALGFYPVTPGDSIYIIGKPLLNSATINLDKPFHIEAHQLSAENRYIQRVTFNGKEYTKSFITYNMIINGGTLEFFMGKSPSDWGTKNENCPRTIIDNNNFVAMPFYVEGQRSFSGKTTITLESIEPKCKIFYTIDGSTPTENSILYIGPFEIDSSCEIYSICIDEKGNKSNINRTKLIKLDEGKKISIYSSYSSEYTGGGDIALIDGIMGKADYRTGEWQGYQDTCLLAVIDLSKPTMISTLSAHFLRDVNSWILFPPYIKFSVSSDNVHFQEVAIIENMLSNEDWTPQEAFFSTQIQPIEARYVRVFVPKPGNLPQWHPGAGYPAFFFIDEIIIK